VAAFAFIGFGELGSALAGGLFRGGAGELRAFAPRRDDPAATAALERRLEECGVARAGSIAAAVDGAQVVFSVVPASESVSVAAEAAPELERGSFYVDAATAPPHAKEQAAALVQAAGGEYVDAAVLGAAVADGFAVPFLVSGPGARAWAELVAPLGLNVSVLDGPAGAAARVKLLRSVYMKGRDALILEMLVAARRYGVEEALIESIKGAGETVPFPQLADRVLRSLALHAGRRADELEESAAVLRAAAVDPLVTEGGVERLRWLAALGLRDRFHGERPDTLEDVLRAVEEEQGAGSAPA
jgi:3-hydroxyisobutyrate dehydrogenase-like beta-hydroxyacid dehydrogenase